MTWWLKSLSRSLHLECFNALYQKKNHNKLFDHIYDISPGTKHHQQNKKKPPAKVNPKNPRNDPAFNNGVFCVFFPSSFTRLWWLHEGIHEVVQVSGVNHLGVDFQNPLKLLRCFLVFFSGVSKWWLNQPIWKIWIKFGFIFPQIGVKI